MDSTFIVARADRKLQSSSDLLQVRRAEQFLRSKMLFAAWSTQYEQQKQHHLLTKPPWSVSPWSSCGLTNRLPYVRKLFRMESSDGPYTTFKAW